MIEGGWLPTTNVPDLGEVGVGDAAGGDVEALAEPWKWLHHHPSPILVWVLRRPYATLVGKVARPHHRDRYHGGDRPGIGEYPVCDRGE